MISSVHQLQRLLAKNLLAAPPSPFAAGIGIRLRQADQPHKLNDRKSQAPDESLESRDPLMNLEKEYFTRCEDDGYGGIIYGKDKSSNTAKDEEENTNNNNTSPTNCTGN